MSHHNNVLTGTDDLQACSFLQTCSLKKGLQKFGDKGVAALNKEMKQLRGRVVFEPIHIDEMTALSKEKEQWRVSFF